MTFYSTRERTAAPQTKTSLVYVIDDNPDVRHSLGFLLRSNGLECAEYPNPTSFLAAAPSLSPGCVLSDVQMFGSTCDRFQAHLKTLSSNWNVMLMSGSEEDNSVKASKEEGAVGFISKPFDEEELLTLLNKCYSLLQ